VAVGTQKTSEELVKYWQELFGRYPSVIAIIDPLRKQVRSVYLADNQRSRTCWRHVSALTELAPPFQYSLFLRRD